MTIRRWLAEKLGVKFSGAAEDAATAPAARKELSTPFVYFRTNDFITPIAPADGRRRNYGIEDIQDGWVKIGELIRKTPGVNTKASVFPIGNANKEPNAYALGNAIIEIGSLFPHWQKYDDGNIVCMDACKWKNTFNHVSDIEKCVQKFKDADIKSNVIVSMATQMEVRVRQKQDPAFDCGMAARKLETFVEAFKAMDQLHRPRRELLAERASPAPQPQAFSG